MTDIAARNRAITYSNPRMEAVITNWPIGSQRTTATFRVETHPTRGQRGTRFLIDPKTGKPMGTKTLTYAPQVRIVDGDDGRTYFIETTIYGFVTVMRGDAKFQEETIFARDQPERHAAVMALFADALASAA